jgi:hypothetical protein
MTTRWRVGLVTNARIFFVPTEKKQGYMQRSNFDTVRCANAKVND